MGGNSHFLWGREDKVSLYLYRLGAGDVSEFISIFTVIFKTRCGGEWHRLRRLKEQSNQCQTDISGFVGQRSLRQLLNFAVVA